MDWGASEDSDTNDDDGDNVTVEGMGDVDTDEEEKVVDEEGEGGITEVERAGGETAEGTISIFDDGATPVGRPRSARALTTASQPFSRVLIRSLSSSFSRSLASSEDDLIGAEDTRTGADVAAAGDIPMPARS